MKEASNSSDGCSVLNENNMEGILDVIHKVIKTITVSKNKQKKTNN